MFESRLRVAVNRKGIENRELKNTKVTEKTIYRLNDKMGSQQCDNKYDQIHDAYLEKRKFQRFGRRQSYAHYTRKETPKM